MIWPSDLPKSLVKSPCQESRGPALNDQGSSHTQITLSSSFLLLFYFLCYLLFLSLLLQDFSSPTHHSPTGKLKTTMVRIKMKATGGPFMWKKLGLPRPIPSDSDDEARDTPPQQPLQMGQHRKQGKNQQIHFQQTPAGCSSATRRRSPQPDSRGSSQKD